MRVSLFTKFAKPTVDKAISYLKSHSSSFDLYQGKPGDPFPAESFRHDSDVVISYLSPWIIPKLILDKTKLWNINFHPGSLDYPGIGCFNFAIYDQAKTYGVTAHLMDEKVDRGKIVGIKEFPLEKEDSVLTLAEKSYETMIVLFFEVMDFIFKNKKLPQLEKSWQREPYRRKDLENLCLLDKNMAESEVKRRVKATTYPNMPGAYFDFYGFKFEYSPNR